MFNTQKFSEALRVKRAKDKIKVKDAAIQLGLNIRMYYRFEEGSIPDINTFGKCCTWLNVNPGIFFTD